MAMCLSVLNIELATTLCPSKGSLSVVTRFWAHEHHGTFGSRSRRTKMGVLFNMTGPWKPSRCSLSKPAKGEGKDFNTSASNMYANAKCGHERVLGYHPCSLDSSLCRQLALPWMETHFLGPHNLPR